MLHHPIGLHRIGDFHETRDIRAVHVIDETIREIKTGIR
jgi:hypothetical protein